jgi:recombination protein RecA
MPSAATIRREIEATLARKIPSALTPAARIIRPLAPTGFPALDQLLNGGFPIGAVTELVGPECSGRTSIALSFLAQITHSARVCAWIDVSNALDPFSAAASGVDLTRLLWVRCGMQKPLEPVRHTFTLPGYLVPTPTKKGLHDGGCGPHPRTEANNLSHAVHGFLSPVTLEPRCAEPQPRRRSHPRRNPEPQFFEPNPSPSTPPTTVLRPTKPWSRMEQAIRSTDLLLQGGGFSAIVLDMGSLSPEAVSRVPLATWYRYRAAAERTQSSILLLTQHPCAKSSAELMLRLDPASPICDETTVFSGIEPRVEVLRQRFTEVPTNVIPMRKPPARANLASWHIRTHWAGRA